jgi:hypothetical protein
MPAEIENDPGMEERGIFDAILFAEAHWTKLTAPSLASPADLVLTESAEMDKRLVRTFRGEFGTSFDIVNVTVASLKAKGVREKWRSFLEAVGAAVPLYHMMTLLRLDAKLGYTSDNTILVPRVQYLMIEGARNAEGANDAAALGYTALLDEVRGLRDALRRCFRRAPDLFEALKVLTSLANHFPTLPRRALRTTQLEKVLRDLVEAHCAEGCATAMMSAANAERAKLFAERVEDLQRSWDVAQLLEASAVGGEDGRGAEIATLAFLQLEGKWSMLPRATYARFERSAVAAVANAAGKPAQAAADAGGGAAASGAAGGGFKVAASDELLTRACRRYGVSGADLHTAAAAAESKPAKKQAAKKEATAKKATDPLAPLPAGLPLIIVDHVPESYATAQDATQIQAFWRWLSDHGGALMRGWRGPTECSGGVRGMQLRKNFKAGDEVARFPSSCWVTALNSLRSPLLAPMLSRSERTRTFCRDFADDGLITLALCLEKRRYLEPAGSVNKRPPLPAADDWVSQALPADWFAWPALEEGWWAPYCEYLPSELDYAGCLDSWSEEELRMLQTPSLITTTRLTRKKMETCYAEIMSMLEFNRACAADQSMASLKYTATAPGQWQSAAEALAGLTYDEFAWAWHSVVTRCFGVRTRMLEHVPDRPATDEEEEEEDEVDVEDEDVGVEDPELVKTPERQIQRLVTACLARAKMQAMVPGLDMLNHSPTPTVANKPQEDGDRAYIEVCAVRDVEAGSDFTFNYGAHMRSEMMLTTYGFCLGAPTTRTEAWSDAVDVAIQLPGLPLERGSCRVPTSAKGAAASFERADSWSGARKGWFFGTKVYGTGYYRDNRSGAVETLVKLGAVSIDGVTAVWTSPLMKACRVALGVVRAAAMVAPRDFLCNDARGSTVVANDVVLARLQSLPKLLFEFLALSLAVSTLEDTLQRYETSLAADREELAELLTHPAVTLQPAGDLQRARRFTALNFRMVVKIVVVDHIRILRAARDAIVRTVDGGRAPEVDTLAVLQGFMAEIARDDTVVADEAADAVVYVEKHALAPFAGEGSYGGRRAAPAATPGIF